ncbi:indole-3-glycerol-phosphate synthase [Chryseomicrobium excrementi]|uniref:Indole-3-glycerol phosphate synthase n=1 Tax=Chryseomicrobium excrementi TaxID=2041346 RepID=A0A2M9EXF8_9BACL|nr:indole-3-glycerol phosphate synthase TrpC [Chryseomicrobium excrementi]PJK15878.1 indole-3-glycerol-phosphate synthase [Chryseomicrobium excrementi]
MTILDTILETKQHEVRELQLTHLPQRTIGKRLRLADSLRASDTLEVIAEIKRASPSKGLIYKDLDAVAQATRYVSGGAAAISVLTDSKYFQGSFTDLEQVAQAVPLPVLCKDFVIDRIQIDAAYSYGASIILLIVAALDKQDLHDLYRYATSKGLEVLVEVHDEEELEMALQLGAELIGVNNRDLRTFTVSLETTERLAKRVADLTDVHLISESGIESADDAERLSSCGAKGLLVGESLVRSSSVEDALQSLKVRRKVHDTH